MKTTYIPRAGDADPTFNRRRVAVSVCSIDTLTPA